MIDYEENCGFTGPQLNSNFVFDTVYITNWK